jgi:hypothetical protein
MIAECSQDLEPARRYSGRMSNPDVNDRSTDFEVPELLPERAFVIEFRGGGTPGLDDPLSGRVEHVSSGKATRFESATELIDFLRDVLRSCGQTRGATS